MNLWLIGAGQMAQDYAQVLKALDVQFEVIGRGTNSASKFFYKIGYDSVRFLIDSKNHNIENRKYV